MTEANTPDDPDERRTPRKVAAWSYISVAEYYEIQAREPWRLHTSPRLIVRYTPRDLRRWWGEPGPYDRPPWPFAGMF